jgi:threonine dehydrogenase-like Zn-dependent dehydrogenase
LKLGADVVIDPARTSPFKTWEEYAQLSPEEIAKLPPTIVPVAPLKPAAIFECVGVPGVIQSIFEAAPQNAQVVLVGVCMETDQMKPMFASFKELSVQFVLGCTPDEFAQSLDLIASGVVDAPSMITGKIGLDEVAGAFDELASPNRHTKIVVEPWR